MKRSILLSVLLFALALGYGLLNAINGRFTMYDLQVYYDAAGQLMAGKSPYLQPFGLSSGYYKYAPIVALLFAPLHGLGWLGARLLFFGLIAASVAWYLPFFTKKVLAVHRYTMVNSVAVALGVALALFGHFSRELLLGNVNWLLMVMVLSAFFAIERKPLVSGVLLAIAIAFKPHFVVLLPWFVLRLRWVELASTLVTLVAVLVLPAAGFGWSTNLTLLAEWGSTMQQHNAALAESPNTFYGVPSRLFRWEGPLPVLLTIGLVALSVLALVLRNYWREATRNANTQANMLLEFSVIMALIPNIVHTDTEHFMWTFPLLVLVAAFVVDLRAAKKARWLVAGISMVLLIPYALATPDLWGAEGSRWLEQSGVLGWANFTFIVIALYAHQKHEKRIA